MRTVRGTRSYGSAAMEIAFVVSGKLDAYLSMRLSPWDIAGGIIIAKEVGAIATNFNGNQFDLLINRYVYYCKPFHPSINFRSLH